MNWKKWPLLAASLLVCFVAASDYDEPALLDIAHEAIVSEVGGTPVRSVTAHDLPVRPVFVTIEIGGVIRGCRGSLTTRTTSLGDEIRLAARGAAQHDPRYRPLTQKEIGSFKVTVTIVEGQDLIESVAGLQPSDGLALEARGKWGIVLPWEGKDPQVRLRWAYQKAGVSGGSGAKLFRLRAVRFRG